MCHICVVYVRYMTVAHIWCGYFIYVSYDMCDEKVNCGQGSSYMMREQMYSYMGHICLILAAMYCRVLKLLLYPYPTAPSMG